MATDQRVRLQVRVDDDLARSGLETACVMVEEVHRFLTWRDGGELDPLPEEELGVSHAG